MNHHVNGLALGIDDERCKNSVEHEGSELVVNLRIAAVALELIQ